MRPDKLRFWVWKLRQCGRLCRIVRKIPVLTKGFYCRMSGKRFFLSFYSGHPPQYEQSKKKERERRFRGETSVPFPQGVGGCFKLFQASDFQYNSFCPILNSYSGKFAEIPLFSASLPLFSKRLRYAPGVKPKCFKKHSWK